MVGVHLGKPASISSIRYFLCDFHTVFCASVILQNIKVTEIPGCGISKGLCHNFVISSLGVPGVVEHFDPVDDDFQLSNTEKCRLPVG